jgi:hypothetical protein
MGTYAPVRPTKYCYTCGGLIDTMAVVCPKCGVLQPAGTAGVSLSEKRILPAVLLGFFLGIFGAHRFYAGKVGTGILQLLTLGGCGIWWMIDMIMLIVGSFTDAEGNKITEWI